MSKTTFLNNSKTKCSIALCFFLILSSVVYAGDNKDVVTFNGEESSSDDFVNAFMGGKKSQELPEDLLPENAKPNTQMKFRGISLKKNTTKPEEQQKKLI